MKITINNTDIQLEKSNLDTRTINQVFDFWREKEAQISYFESEELCIICLQKSHKTTRGTYWFNDYDKGRLLFARQYMIDHLSMPPSIAELSSIAGINQFKLKNGFRELFGNTVYGYLNQVRLEKARVLMTQGEKNLTQIAFELGFSSLQHFSTAFKKAYGCSPKKIKTTPPIS
jgi:AraC-like DNA-binding protein